ncbi:MAG: YebC/PmpR family DNA-binding transcriptional regulator [Planctomycetes bacterium]|nr:YebC/PmpR family DNA-binding transcriptional regulator [Planctomycetota bacterium]MBL7007710.1 YebC/PmpR family DNA-binding transcriptional regulator [Planctomycetota bacterium]
MAGHSHWANIQRTKSKMDAKRGKVFSKWAKLIMNAARNGGADTDMNLSLRYAIERARADNMPKDSIERAVKKGAGELDGVHFEEVTYEAYGPGGVAIVIEALTDNRNRTAPDMRHILDRRGGSLGTTGTVLWMFERKAAFAVKRAGPAADEDEFMLFALELGADDVTTDEEEILGVTADMGLFMEIKTALEEGGYETVDAAIRYIPKTSVGVDAATGQKILDLMDALEDNDDVQGVHNNADFLED